MVNFHKFAAVAIVYYALGSVTAHPGEHHDHVEVRASLHRHNTLAITGKRSLEACINTVDGRALAERANIRRFVTAENLRRQRNPKSKSSLGYRSLIELEGYSKKDHEINLTGIHLDNLSKVFSANTSVAFTPQQSLGPLGPYFVEGNRIKTNLVTDGQKGVPLQYEMQFVNIETCKSIPGLFVDSWSVNATGVYSGVVGPVNGNPHDASNINTTFCRGAAISDWDGVVQWDTLFPGHYAGRATHLHSSVHTNATLLLNGTYMGGNWSHVGEVYFDESLRSEVEATWPYNTNKVAVTSNLNDVYAPVEASATYDPYVQCVKLGDDIQDGVFAWISIGINTTYPYPDFTRWIASFYEADGGHVNPNDTFYKDAGFV